MYKAEQLNLFEIEAEDSLAVYGTDSIPFLVVTTPAVILGESRSESVTASETAETATKSSPPNG